MAMATKMAMAIKMAMVTKMAASHQSWNGLL
jgi:hypothetical protein